MIKNLAKWIKLRGLIKLSQQIEELNEWAEPWHEEVVKEFGEEIEEEDISSKEVLYTRDLNWEEFGGLASDDEGIFGKTYRRQIACISF